MFVQRRPAAATDWAELCGPAAKKVTEVKVMGAKINHRGHHRGHILYYNFYSSALIRRLIVA